MTLVTDLIREDGEKLQAIMQFLESRQLLSSLAQLQEETEVEYKPTALKTGAVLDDAFSRVEVVSEGRLEKEGDPFHHIQNEGGLCATSVALSLASAHGSANPTCIAFHPSDPAIVITGGVDKRVCVTHKLRGLIGEVSVPSPELAVSTAFAGEADGDSFLIAAGCMGGELCVFAVTPMEGGEGGEVGIRTLHSKKGCGFRLSSVVFSPCGGILATAGKDFRVTLFSVKGDEVLERPEWTIRCVKDVSCIEWIGESTLLVGETDNPILAVYEISGQSAPKRVRELCMNYNIHDPRTGYTALAATWDQGSGLLAVSTNRNSVLVFTLKAASDGSEELVCPVKTYYGMSVGIYDFPSLAFSQDATHLYVSSDKELLVFEVKSGHRIFSIPVSTEKPIRGMRKHPSGDILATVSFDKTVTFIEGGVLVVVVV